MTDVNHKTLTDEQSRIAKQFAREWAEGFLADLTVPCPDCGGHGDSRKWVPPEMEREPCSGCGGTGEVRAREVAG